MTPRFELSVNIALEQFEKVKSLCDVASYSSKTNPLVTPILEENTSSLFSIHLENELVHIKDKSRVVFLAQGWNSRLIPNLYEKGIKWFIVDNEVDLENFITYLNDSDAKDIKLLLRLKLKEHSIRTEKYYVFGMNSDTIKKRISEISQDKNLKDKISMLGIHFHRKSQNMSEWNLQFELEEMFDKKFFNQIQIINIGGGIPSVYANTNIKAFDSIFKKILDFKSWLNRENIKLMIEPGRFISAPAGKLITKIISITEDTIIVDASVYNSDLDALIVPVKLLVEDEVDSQTTNQLSQSADKKADDKPIKRYIIKGVTPCSMDLFRYKVYLPEKKVGDIITFINAGAYNFQSDFCSLNKIPTFITKDY